MNTFVDIVLVVYLLLGAYAGFKKGIIKSLVGFIGLIAVIILSYSLKTSLANFLINNMPFFNFSGSLEGLTSLNILIYNAVSFIVIFILLYCILNLIIVLTGFIDTLLKFTVIWILPSKILGAIVGFVEAWLFAFLVIFALSSFNFTNVMVRDCKMTDIILNHTPIVGKYLGGLTKTAQEVYDVIDNYNGDTKSLNLRILQIEIKYGLISKEKATELMETGTIELDNVLFS